MTHISSKRLFIAILSMVLICPTLSAVPALSQEPVVTVVGVVTEDSQLVADDGEIYEVASSREGDAVKELLDKKVQVTGSVYEQNGIKIIEVVSYQIIK